MDRLRWSSISSLRLMSPKSVRVRCRHELLDVRVVNLGDPGLVLGHHVVDAGGRPGVVEGPPSIRQQQQDHAAGAEDAVDLVEHPQGVGQVLEDLTGDDEVQARVSEGRQAVAVHVADNIGIGETCASPSSGNSAARRSSAVHRSTMDARSRMREGPGLVAGADLDALPLEVASEGGAAPAAPDSRLDRIEGPVVLPPAHDCHSPGGRRPRLRGRKGRTRPARTPRPSRWADGRPPGDRWPRSGPGLVLHDEPLDAGCQRRRGAPGQQAGVLVPLDPGSAGLSNATVATPRAISSSRRYDGARTPSASPTSHPGTGGRWPDSRAVPGG